MDIQGNQLIKVHDAAKMALIGGLAKMVSINPSGSRLAQKDKLIL